MTNEGLSKWAAIAEIVSGIAVVISLLFILQELNNNTNAVQSATLQAAMDTSNAYLLMLIENPELLQLNEKGRQSYTSLTPEELMTYTMLTRNQWVRFQTNYSQWKRGVLDDEDWYFYEKIYCNVSSDEGFVLSWPLHRDFLRPDFVEYVESCEAY